MRTIPIIILLLLSMAGKAQQGYKSFPMQDAWWQYSQLSNSGDIWFSNYEQIMVVADEITIDGKLYHKLISRVSSTSNVTDKQASQTPDNLAEAADKDFGAIREENKRVYVKIDGVPELILFDFNLNVGEMMPITKRMVDYEQVYLKIENIDNITLGGTPRKRFHLAGGMTVIEGAGGSFGLYKREPFPKNVTSFLCSYDGADYINTCNYIWPYGTPTSVESVDQGNAISIYPNPCTDVLNIKAPANTTVEVYDAVGKLIIKNHAAKQTINTMHWPVGLYIVKLYDTNRQLLKQEKVVKE